MANGDVDAINERLNGLVNLLQVVGIDGVNPNALVEEQKRLGGSKGHGQAAAPQSSDAQILEIIKKLQLAQADSPEILAALQSPELRALASLAAQKQGGQKAPEKTKKTTAPSLDDVMEDDDNYPKIGPGYSDDVSVYSDISTPTVMTKQQVSEEEYYREVNGGPGSLPPMHIASAGPAQPARPSLGTPGMVHGGAHPHPGKTKNMVGQVRPSAARRAIAKSGGAAAQRRLNYQMAMTKLQSNPNEIGNSGEHGSPKKTQKSPVFAPASPTPSQTPMEFPSMAGDGSVNDAGKKGGAKRLVKKGKKTALASQEVSDLDFEGTEPIQTPPTSTSATSGSTSNIVRKKPNSDIDWGVSDSGGWPAFDAGNTSSNSKDIFVDNDGFFPTDAFSSPDGFGSTSPGGSLPSKPLKRPGGSSSVSGGKKSSREGSSKKIGSSSRSKKEGDAKKEKDKSGKKKTRRASLSM
jgi:hypothetical protein